jgi:hypothetical protein
MDCAENRGRRHWAAMTPPHAELPKSLLLGGNLPVDGALSLLWFEPYITGDQPHACVHELTEVGAEATLLPPGITPDRTNVEDGRRSHLASGAGWTLVVLGRRSSTATIRVCATSPELAREVADAAAATAVRAVGVDELPVGFWRRKPCGGDGVRSPRHIAVPEWAEIRDNYNAVARAALGRLMSVRPESVAGHLVLLHGPTGTGKTTALRALSREWRDWCQLDAVLDPEELFTDPGYLSSVVMGPPLPSAERSRRWRMLVLEDCDALVGAGARAEAGRQLSRLLNLTDGMLGQGLEVLVCLTTNEPVGALHPAVVRPGRCLAEIEVGRLDHAEASAWLGASAPADGASLAELYHLRAAARSGTHTGEDDPGERPTNG